MEEGTRLEVTKLPKRETLIIRQVGKPAFFVSSYNVIALEVSSLTAIIKFLIQNGFMSKKALEGILSELED